MVGISSLLLFCSHLLSGRRFCVFLSWYNVMTCSASVAGTAMVGMRTQGKVVIVDMPKLGDVINPRLTAMTRSAIPNTFQTTRAYFDQLYPLQRKMAKGIAVTPTKMSPTPSGIAMAGSKSPWVMPQRNAIPDSLHVWAAIRREVVLLYCICSE